MGMFLIRMAPSIHHFLLLSLLLLSISSGCCCADGVDDIGPWECSFVNNYTDGDPFKTNLDKLLTSLSANAPTTGFYKDTVGNKSNKVYGLVQCRGDISGVDCAKCINNATKQVLHDCSNSKRVQVWLTKCYLHYSDENFFGNLGMSSGSMAVSYSTDYDDAFVALQGVTLMTKLATTTPNQALMFQTTIIDAGKNGKRYGMAQCTRDLNRADCGKCLDKLMLDLGSSSYNKRGWEIFTMSCRMWYNDYQLFSANYSLPSNRGTRKVLSQRVQVSLIAFLMLMVLNVF
ncbi:PREDICTED: cysteine-rich repeat secretory protein 38-like [Nelumbo nucifera]|uniref:Cysteine-rich repeat secretory protein 38-like n=2 Tax=Nelumbo nucifera TaxID=4432 RepID=A0A1U7Z1T7_NELNU|nr:PREDICTED: cysteine-rich repeat secretory protein 38-like [Nelumbo nucifera]DAD20635.1 TPA_asm: hypothetical protein HUJ06_022098 [Nelumbo nucifera]